MAGDDTPDRTDGDDPTIVVEQQTNGDAPLWSEHDGDSAEAADARARVEDALEGVQGTPATATPDEPVASAADGEPDATPADDAPTNDDETSGVRDRASAVAGDMKEAAAATAAQARERAGEAKERAGERAADARDKAGAKASEARDRAAAFAASARERAANTDVKELAASTTSLIDTARPFFLAAFAMVFTVLGFVEGDSGTSQWFVVGAILFVLAAGFSDELGHLLPRRRREGED